VKVSPDFVRTEGGELSVEEMYKRTLQEVGSLREQLAERKRCTRGHCKRLEVSGSNLVGQDQLLLIILLNYSRVSMYSTL
jgi:hypothetical protein